MVKFDVSLEFGIALVAAVVGIQVFLLWLRWAGKREHSYHSWLKMLRSPIVYAFLAMPLFVFLGQHTVVYGVKVDKLVDHLIFWVYAILVFWSVWRLISALQESWVASIKPEDEGFDQTDINAVIIIIKTIAILILTVFVMNHYNLPFSALLAFGGVGGFAVALASKDLLANLFGGLMIFIDRPFGVGEWVSSPDRNIEGTVEGITWRLTKIRTFDRRVLYVPNAIFLNIVIMNPSRMTHRRINLMLQVRYKDAGKVRVLVEDIRNYLAENSAIDQKQAIYVGFAGMSSSALDIEIKALTRCKQRIEFMKIQQEILLMLLEIVERHGADCAFPTRTVVMDN